MGGRTKKLKRQSDGSPEDSQHDPFVLFLDETNHNCKPIHDALNLMDVPYIRHGALFRPGALDTEWLPVVGDARYALLTCDQRIRYNQLEREKIVEHKIREFVLTSGNLSGAMMGEILKKAVPKMKKLFRKYPGPFIAYISQSGNVEIRWDKDGTFDARKGRSRV